MALGLFGNKKKGKANDEAEQTTKASFDGMDKKTKKLYNKYKINPVDVDFFISDARQYTIDSKQIVMCCVNLKAAKKNLGALVDAINNDYLAYYDPSTLVNDEVFIAWTDKLSSQPLPDVDCEPLLLDINMLEENNLSITDLKSPMLLIDFADISSKDALIDSFNLADLMTFDEAGDENYDGEDEGYDEDGEEYEEYDESDDDFGGEGFDDDGDDFGDEVFDDEGDDFGDADDDFGDEGYEEDFGGDDMGGEYGEDFDPSSELDDFNPEDEEPSFDDEVEEKEITFSSEENILDYSLADTQADIYDIIGAHVDILSLDDLREAIVTKISPLIASATNVTPIERFVPDSPEFESLTKALNLRVDAANSALKANSVRLVSELNQQVISSVNQLIGLAITMPEFIVETDDSKLTDAYVYMNKLNAIKARKAEEIDNIDNVVLDKEEKLRAEYEAERQTAIDAAAAIAAANFDETHKHVLDTKIKNLTLNERNAIEAKALSEIDAITNERNSGVKRVIEIGLDAVIGNLKLQEARNIQDNYRQQHCDLLNEYMATERETELDAINKRHSHENFESMKSNYESQLAGLNSEIEKLTTTFAANEKQNEKIAQGKLDKLSIEYEAKLADLNRQFTNAKLSWESERQSLSTSMHMASDKAQQAEDKASIFTDNAKRFVFTVASCAAVVGMLVGFVISTIVH